MHALHGIPWCCLLVATPASQAVNIKYSLYTGPNSLIRVLNSLIRVLILSAIFEHGSTGFRTIRVRILQHKKGMLSPKSEGKKEGLFS